MRTNYTIIILLLFSVVSASFAQSITIISIPWYFAEINKSSIFSLLYALITFLGFFWGLYAGIIIDSINRKKILLIINFINSVFFGSVGLLTVLYGVQHDMFFFLNFFLCSFYYIIFFPTLYAIIKELTHPLQYVKINSLVEVFFQTTTIIAATICGVLLSGSEVISEYIDVKLIPFEKWEIGEVFLLNSIMYLITAISMLYIPYRPKSNTKTLSIKNTFNEFNVSLNFFKKNKSILIYGICSQSIFGFLIVELFTLLPLFVKNCLNENILVFSLADVTYAIGAIIAGFITIKILNKIDTISYTIFLIIITGFSFLIMIKFINIYIFFLSTLIVGITNSSARITRMSYFFKKIPNNLMGRTNTIFNTINTALRGCLILVFSIKWFAYKNHVIIGYKIGIYVLIVFAIILLWSNRKLYLK